MQPQIMKDLKHQLIDFQKYTTELSLEYLSNIKEKGLTLDNFPYLDKSYLGTSLNVKDFNAECKKYKNIHHTIQVIHVLDWIKFLKQNFLELSKPIKYLDSHPNYKLSEVDKCLLKHINYSGDPYNSIGYIKNYNRTEPNIEINFKDLRNKFIYSYSKGSDYVLLFIPTDLTYYSKFEKSWKFKVIKKVIFKILNTPFFKSKEKSMYAALMGYIILTSCMVFLNGIFLYITLGLWLSYVSSVVFLLKWKRVFQQSYQLDTLNLRHLKTTSNKIIKLIYAKIFPNEQL